MTMAFNAGKHPRATGGRFGATGAAQAAAGRPTGAWATGPVRQGVGKRGAPDARVKAMQSALNRLGVSDEHGRPLLLDGIDGAHTTAAVKKFQAANHLPVTGVVDAKTMLAILTAKPKAQSGRKRTARHLMSHSSRPKAPARTKPTVAVHKQRITYQ